MDGIAPGWAFTVARPEELELALAVSSVEDGVRLGRGVGMELDDGSVPVLAGHPICDMATAIPDVVARQPANARLEHAFLNQDASWVQIGETQGSTVVTVYHSPD